jgi:riboflavin synthase
VFTGIVEELGTVVAIEQLSDAARLTVRGAVVTADADHGASIAVNGVCLTVVDHEADWFTADVMAETLNRSSLGGLHAGSRVNLERPVRLSDRLGGHLVQGHVDGIAAIISRAPGQNWAVVRIGLPNDLARYVVEKGSITVDGVSLTVSALDDGRVDSASWFEVSLIPTTLELTTLGHKQAGDPVNLEVDVVAKYVERLMTPTATPATTPTTTPPLRPEEQS